MSNAKATNCAAHQWSKLLRETQEALSTLRDQDLDDLAARAQCMLIATVGQESVRQCIPAPGPRELVEVAREHRLLSDLLAATDTNLEVLRRTCRYGHPYAAEANTPWGR